MSRVLLGAAYAPFLLLCLLGGAAWSQTVSLAERQEDAARIVPVALGAEAVIGDVGDRARARLLGPAEERHGGIAVWGTVRGQPLVNFDSAGFDGRLLGGAFGIEGMASSSVLVGARIGYDDTNLTTALDGLPGHLDSRSFSIIPYAAWKPGETWVFDAHIGFKRTEFDFFNGGVGAEVNSDRFIAGLGASALYGFAGLQVIPRFSGLIAVDSAVSFTDSAGIDVPTNRLTYFEASGGAEIGYPVQLGAMRLTPWVAGHIVGVLDDVGGASLVGDTVFGRFGAGLRLGAGPLDIVLEGRASGFGPRDFNDYQGMLRIAYSFQ